MSQAGKYADSACTVKLIAAKQSSQCFSLRSNNVHGVKFGESLRKATRFPSFQQHPTENAVIETKPFLMDYANVARILLNIVQNQ